jgi:hypothetical protein
MAELSKSSGNTRFTTWRFSSMYDTPEGTRRLSSRTYTVPSLSRIRSEPQMCAQVPSGGLMPLTTARKFFEVWMMEAGISPSRMNFCWW